MNLSRDRRIGVAVVGLGVGAEHARAYHASEQCDLRWLHDHDQEKARALCQELGGRVAASFDEILADPLTHAVSIASFDHDHYDQTLRALEAGKHVFVEKPLCRSFEELGAIKRAWHGRGLVLASNLVLRTAPLYQWLGAAVRSGALGALYAIDGEYLYGRVEKITRGWRKDVPDYSVMLGGGIHLVDLMLSLAGLRPERVAAAGNRIATAGTDFRCNDFVTSLFEFPSGLIGRISANFGCMHRHQHVLRVFGTKATFLYDDAGARLWTSRDPSAAPEPIGHAPLPAGKGGLIPGFVEAMASGAESGPAAQREFDLASVCLAADQSVREGKTVRITYL